MTRELYELLEAEFIKQRIGDEVEDVLLEMAETLAEKHVIGKEITCKEKLGRAAVEACGVCEADEENPDEVNVYIKTLKIGKRVYKVEDYFL